MASKFAISSFSAASRNVVSKSLRQPLVSNMVRYSSSTPEVKPTEPKAKANSLIDSLPGNSIISKTGFVTVGATLATWLISKEIYVINEETVVAASFLTVVGLILKNAKIPYNEWAEGRLNFIKNLLVEARQNHKVQVSERIEAATQLADIVPVTKDLFAMSKEMAEMQAKIFELKQQVQVNTEIKSTLDSWVRFENAIREREQSELATSVLASVEKSLKDPKIQAQLLKEAIADAQKLIAKA